MIGKHVVIDTLDNFKAKLDLIPSSAIVLIKDVGQIYAHGTYFGAQKTYSLLTKTADGLAPKGGTSASSLISDVDTEWVLTVTNGENPTWRKLPANAFSSSSYTLPSATVSDLGGIKVGQVYTATFDDLVGLYYKVNIDKNGLAYVHVPWVNNPYTASGSGITLKDNVFSLSLNSATKLDSAIGNKIYAVSLDKNGKLCVSVPWTDTNNIFVGATETKNGSSGMVPAPIANQHRYFLRGNGTWVKPNLSDLNDDVVSGKYLPLSGGTINGELTITSAVLGEQLIIKRNDYANLPAITFQNTTNGIVGYLGVTGSNSDYPYSPVFVDSDKTSYKIYHSGNFNPSDYLPKSGGELNGKLTIKTTNWANQLEIFRNVTEGNAFITYSNSEKTLGYIGICGKSGTHPYEPCFSNGTSDHKIWHSGTFNPSDYLPLSGGIMNGWIYFKDKSLQLGHNDNGYFEIFNARASYCGLGLWDNGAVKVYTNSKWNDIIHSGNISSQSVSYATSAGRLYTGQNNKVTHYPTQIGIEYFGDVNQQEGLFYADNNANGILHVRTHGENFIHQLGFSSNGNIYSRYFSAKLPDTTTTWKRIAFTDSNVASANYASSAGNADTLDGKHLASGNKIYNRVSHVAGDGVMEIGKYIDFHNTDNETNDYSTRIECTASYKNTVYLPSMTGTLALTTDNVASATKLKTRRTIWGQGFDGSGNVSGNMTEVSSITMSGDIIMNNNMGVAIKNTNGAHKWVLLVSTDNRTLIGSTELDSYIRGNNVNITYGSSQTSGIYLNSSGNVGIGTTSPVHKLDVNGTIYGSHYYGDAITLYTRGNGTYTRAWITAKDSAGDFIIEAPLTAESSGTRAPITLTWRGGYPSMGGLKITGYSEAVLGGNKIWHEGNDGSESGLNADLLDGYHEYSFLRYRNLGSNGGATLWSQIGIRSYHNALPEGLSGLYNYGQVVSLPGSGSRLDIFTNHVGSSESEGLGGLWWRSGWENDKRTWRRIIDSGNISSQSVSYASSSGNANTVDNYHISVTSSAGTDTSTIYFVT